MLIRRPAFLGVLVFAAICVLSTVAACESDQAVAERVLGPQWKHISQQAGMVFAGTALADRLQTERKDRGVAAIALRFRVDRAIAGVESGQVLTIHEWAGAASLYPSMRRGEHVLLFLYPLSRLGLTSPVGGPQGQVRLDESGRNVVGVRTVTTQNGARSDSRSVRDSISDASPTGAPATLDQLERAIRRERGSER